jgi:hypothetical protein
MPTSTQFEGWGRIIPTIAVRIQKGPVEVCKHDKEPSGRPLDPRLLDIQATVI